MWRCFFIAVLTLAVAALAAASRAKSSGAGLAAQPDRVVLTYAGKPVTYRDLTLLTYAQIQRRLRVAARYAKRPADGLWPRVRTIGMAHGIYFQPPRGASALEEVNDIAHLCLRTAVDHFLRARVRAEFERLHPCDENKFYRVALLPKYSLAYARIWQEYARVYAESSERHWTVAQLANALHKAFPKMRSPNPTAMAKIAVSWMRRQPEWYIVTGRCFPCEWHGVVAPWYASGFQNSLLKFNMSRVIRANRAKYTLIAAKLYGTSGFVTATDLLPQDKINVVRIINSCRVAGGKLDTVKLNSIQTVLWYLGSPTEILPGYGGDYSYFTSLTGLPMRQIAPRRFVPLKNKRHSFLYIYQKVPMVHKMLVTMRMSSFLWDIGEWHLLTPICKRVLAKAHAVAPWLKLPTLSQLIVLSAASDGQPQTRSMGFKLPEIVRKKYRKEPW